VDPVGPTRAARRAGRQLAMPATRMSDTAPEARSSASSPNAPNMSAPICHGRYCGSMMSVSGCITGKGTVGSTFQVALRMVGIMAAGLPLVRIAMASIRSPWPPASWDSIGTHTWSAGSDATR